MRKTKYRLPTKSETVTQWTSTDCPWESEAGSVFCKFYGNPFRLYTKAYKPLSMHVHVLAISIWNSQQNTFRKEPTSTMEQHSLDILVSPTATLTIGLHVTRWHDWKFSHASRGFEVGLSVPAVYLIWIKTPSRMGHAKIQRKNHSINPIQFEFWREQVVLFARIMNNIKSHTYR